MADDKKPEELNEEDLGEVTGGFGGATASVNRRRRATPSQITPINEGAGRTAIPAATFGGGESPQSDATGSRPGTGSPFGGSAPVPGLGSRPAPRRRRQR